MLFVKASAGTRINANCLTWRPRHLYDAGKYLLLFSLGIPFGAAIVTLHAIKL